MGTCIKDYQGHRSKIKVTMVKNVKKSVLAKYQKMWSNVKITLEGNGQGQGQSGIIILKGRKGQSQCCRSMSK